MQLWVSLIPLKSERLKNKGKQGSSTEIPHTLPPQNFLILFQHAPQFNVTIELFGEASKQEENKIEQDKLKGNFCLFGLFIAESICSNLAADTYNVCSVEK